MSRSKKWNRYFLTHDTVREEMEDFMREWRKEHKARGPFVPAWALVNTTAVLRELEDRGLVHGDGAGGYAPN